MTGQTLENFPNIDGILATNVLLDIDKYEEQSLEIVNEHREEVALPREETFAFPSHAIMLHLLALFTGKPKHMPRKSLLGHVESNSEEQKLMVDGFVSSVLQKPEVSEHYDESGNAILDSKQLAIISDSPAIYADASVPGDLFTDNVLYREQELALYIKRTFGPEGLRHLLGLIIGLEENGRTGEFSFTINDHLERLNYHRSKKGSFDPETKRTALKIIRIFSSLFITSVDRVKNIEKISGLRLFSIEEFVQKRNIQKNELIHLSFKIRANDIWYQSAFDSTKRSPQYTQLLKRIAGENHREHPLTIYLAPYLAVKWRMSGYRPLLLKVKTVMELCGIDHSSANRNRMRELRELEDEFNYMIDAGYLGGWRNKTENWLPSESNKTFECVIEFTAPGWLQQSMPVKKDKKVSSFVTANTLKRIMEETGLSQRKLAASLDISHQQISKVLNGKCNVSSKLANKITEEFGEYMKSVN